MDVRTDLREVEGYIHRLLSIGQDFGEKDREWGHLKNKEDWSRVYSISDADARAAVEKIYGTGRDMAIFMSRELSAINTDFGRYPTLTSILEQFAQTWVYSEELESISSTSRAAAQSVGFENYALAKMLETFDEQVRLLTVVRDTFKILRDTDLYRQENQLPARPPSGSVILQNVSNSQVAVQSQGTSQTSNHHPRPEASPVSRWLKTAVAVATILGAVVTYLAMRQGRDQFTIAQMPILQVASPVLVEPLRIGANARIRVAVRNTPGRDVAQDVLIGAKAQLGDLGFFPDASYQVVDGSRGDLVDTGVLETIVESDHVVTPREIRGLLDGTVEFLVHGEVRFGTRLSRSPAPTRFCFAYNAIGNSFSLCDNRGRINQDKAVFR